LARRLRGATLKMHPPDGRVISELYWLLAEERHEISSPLVWRKERNDDLP
jgi:hypothetical protein